MKTRTLRLLGGFAAFAMVLTACGNGGSGDTTVPMTDTTRAPSDTSGGGGEMSDLGLPIIDPLEVDAGVDIGIAGSSTVYPLSTAVLSMWIDEGGPEYTIDSIGSGGGFERFCTEGASDISNASRPIEAEEVAACQSIGRDPIEIRIGTDALSLVISSGNYFAQELTLEELATAFSLAGSGATWADVSPDFPAHPIALFSPGADSGTFDYFTEVVYPDLGDDDPNPILASIAEIVGEDDNITVNGVADDGCTEGDLTSTCAIGYFGFAYYQANASVLQAVAVDDVVPSKETVDDNSYPLSRPLFMYTAASVIDEKPQVAEFIAYYLNNVDGLIGEVGYFPAPADALQEAADHIHDAAGWE